MFHALTTRQLTGQDDSHLITMASGHQLQNAVALAFERLQHDAQNSGFELEIASSFRSFDRQRIIWDEKATGNRAVYNAKGESIDVSKLTQMGIVHAIMRFSAMPGTSRHHWGTELDVFDAAAMPRDYLLKLSPQEVEPGGLFDPLHNWLDERMASGQSYGFFRPYCSDTGGVAPERWHLSYAPLSSGCELSCTCEVLRSVLEVENIQLWGALDTQFDALFERYVAVPSGWCPALG
ncbi:MAG: LAS superfamily LD-carboxypeptidase LdcB [Halioglobus sp.]